MVLVVGCIRAGLAVVGALKVMHACSFEFLALGARSPCLGHAVARSDGSHAGGGAGPSSAWPWLTCGLAATTCCCTSLCALRLPRQLASASLLCAAAALPRCPTSLRRLAWDYAVLLLLVIAFALDGLGHRPLRSRRLDVSSMP
jgi:hypothetical protein